MRNEMTEKKIGDMILAAVSICQRLANESLGILDEEEKGMCKIFAHELTQLFGRKLDRRRERVNEGINKLAMRKKGPLVPIYRKI